MVQCQQTFAVKVILLENIIMPLPHSFFFFFFSVAIECVNSKEVNIIFMSRSVKVMKSTSLHA